MGHITNCSCPCTPCPPCGLGHEDLLDRCLSGRSAVRGQHLSSFGRARLRQFRLYDSSGLLPTMALRAGGESVLFGSTYAAAHARSVRAGLENMSPGLIGMDPRHVDRVQDRMDDLLAGHLYAKTPIDMAFWDLFGKVVGMPVCDLLDGGVERSLPVISSIHAGASGRFPYPWLSRAFAQD